MTARRNGRLVRFAVLDPLLYGAARAADYLGFRGQDLLDKVGDGILEYGVSEGYFDKSDDPHQFTGNVVKFFVENGYMSEVSVIENGNTLEIGMSDWKFLPIMRKLRERNSYLLTCPVCIANNAITKLAGGVPERISEGVAPDGSWTMKVKIVPGTAHIEHSVIPEQPANFNNVTLPNKLNEKIGTQAFEAVMYGLAYGFDFLGAQGQLLLDNAGAEMVEFMEEELKLQFPRELAEALNVLSKFMVEGGLADHISVQTSNSRISVDFADSRYKPVLERLLQEGRSLVSCPFTLPARSIIKSRGRSVGEMRWQMAGNDVHLVMTTTPLNEQTFNEEHVSKIMDAM